MALKSNQNAILTGYIDAYCLVCETLIIGEDEAERHMHLQSHINNMESTQAVERFKDDKILKVKKGYYCTLCNLIFPTLTKVSLHVAEKDHKTRRGSSLLKRTGSLIRFGDVPIEEMAWQGLVGDMCSVCNAEFDDETVHLAGNAHSLNLVKTKVEFDEGQIYRQIDDSTFQCITCNSVLPLKDIAKHFQDPEHKNILLKQMNDFKFESVQKPSIKVNNKDEPTIENLYDSSTSNSSEVFNSAEGSSDESVYDMVDTRIPREFNKSKILDSVTSFGKNEMNINFESETVLCKKCLQNVDFDFKSIENHIDEHKRNPTKRDSGYVAFPCEADMRTPEPNFIDQKTRLAAITATVEKGSNVILDKNHNEITDKSEKTAASENGKSAEPSNESPADFAKRNHLTYNYGNHNAYCRVCSIRLPSSLRSMQEHVAGKAHRKKLSINQASSSSAVPHTRTRAIRKMPMGDFVNEVLSISNLFMGTVKVVNEKFCVGATSFHLMTENGDRLRCQVCELFIRRLELSTHVESCYHELKFKRIPVVWSIANEFVREVRPGIFHCGFCNIMEASLEGMETHFQSAEHTAKRIIAERTLARHQPAIEEYKKRRTLEHLTEWMLGHRFRRF